MNRFRNIVLLLTLSTFLGTLAQGDEQRTNRVIENPVSDGDLTLRINDGGVKTSVITIQGSTSNVGIGASPLSTAKTTLGGTTNIGSASIPGLMNHNGSDTLNFGLNYTNQNTSNYQIWSDYTSTPTAGEFNIRYRVPNDTGTPSVALKVKQDGFVEFDPPSNGSCGTGTICSGTYSPTLVNGANVSASTNTDCQYMRVGSVVTVSCVYDMNTTTASGTDSGFSIPLPIASNFTTIRQLGGVFTSGNQGTPTSSESVICYSNSANDRAECGFKAFSTTNRTWAGSFTYQVL